MTLGEVNVRVVDLVVSVSGETSFSMLVRVFRGISFSILDRVFCLCRFVLFHDISIPIIGRGVRSPCVDDGRVVEHSLAQHGERASVAESSGTDPRP